MYTPGTIGNSQRMPIKISKYGLLLKLEFYCNDKGNLKTFRILSYKMPALLLILYWWCFSCLHMYSNKFFNIYFHEWMYFKFCASKGDTRFLEVMVLIFYFKSLFQRNENRFIRLVLKAKQLKEIQLSKNFLKFYMNRFSNQFLLFLRFPDFI